MEGKKGKGMGYMVFTFFTKFLELFRNTLDIFLAMVPVITLSIAATIMVWGSQSLLSVAWSHISGITSVSSIRLVLPMVT